MIRVLLADDHSMVRTGLTQFIESAPDMEVVGAATNGREAVRLTTELLPDIVLMDLLMPILDGVEAIRQIKATQPGVAIVALSTSEDPRLVSEALAAGADGYLVKDVEPEVLMAGLRSALTGGVPLSPSITASILGRDSGRGSDSALLGSLTPREREVLGLIAIGHRNREIAAALAISEKTVKTHCSHLFQRIGVTDRQQAAAWARRHLVQP